jgi:hypothetical protein
VLVLERLLITSTSTNPNRTPERLNVSRKEMTMENRSDRAARGPKRSGQEGLRRLGRRLRVPAQRVDRHEAQPFDFDALAQDVAQGLSRREALDFQPSITHRPAKFERLAHRQSEWLRLDRSLPR